MPELPDVVIYIEALEATVGGRRLERVRLSSPFVLRSVSPPLEALHGRTVRALRRIGKRIVMEFGAAADGGPPRFLVLHLMIAGRLRWRRPDEKPGIGSKLLLATLEFEHGRLLFTEASKIKRASMQVVEGEEALARLDPGGIEPLDASFEAFRAALVRENHTVKRVLTDPHVFSGIGNAYSDEILHAARLSPLKLTHKLTDDDLQRLYAGLRSTLVAWVERLRADLNGAFPEQVTAFRPEMAVHGRFKQPCPVCGAPVQRLVYADNEANYCAKCQTGGRLLADRALSRLLGADWPRKLAD